MTTNSNMHKKNNVHMLYARKIRKLYALCPQKWDGLSGMGMQAKNLIYISTPPPPPPPIIHLSPECPLYQTT